MLFFHVLCAIFYHKQLIFPQIPSPNMIIAFYASKVRFDFSSSFWLLKLVSSSTNQSFLFAVSQLPGPHACAVCTQISIFCAIPPKLRYAHEALCKKQALRMRRPPPPRAISLPPASLPFPPPLLSRQYTRFYSEQPFV